MVNYSSETKAFKVPQSGRFLTLTQWKNWQNDTSLGVDLLLWQHGANQAMFSLTGTFQQMGKNQFERLKPYTRDSKEWKKEPTA